MIKLNNKLFAEPKEPTTNCAGLAKRYKKQVKLFNHAGEFIGVINRNGVIAKATPAENGKYWYSYGTIVEIGEYDCYSQSIEDVKSIAVDSTYDANSCEIVYTFK